MPEARRVAQWLGAAGALPFVAAVGAAWLLPDSRIAHWSTTAAFLYGAVILSFLGGIRWGFAVRDQKARGEAFIVSVIPSLLAWGAILMPLRSGLILLAIGFVGQLVVDLRLPLPQWFKWLRVALSVVVVTCLLTLFLLTALQ